MALQKQPVNLNFAGGLDTKTDPKQLTPGKFEALENSVFTTQGLLQKRNGYGALAPLPAEASLLTTFNGNLTAIGTSLQAYSAGSEMWVNKGYIQPLELDTLPLIRSSINQSQADSAVSSNGLVCTVYTDDVPSGGSTTPSYKYAIADSTTGQNIVAPTVIPVPTGTVAGSSRVFILGRYFIIVVTNNISGTYHLKYLAINIASPATIGTAVDITAAYSPATTVAFDGIVANNNLYLAWADATGGIKITYIDSTLVQHNTITVTTYSATMFALAADISTTTPTIWVAYYDAGTSVGKILALTQQMNTVLATTTIISAVTVDNIALTAQSGTATLLYEVHNAYSYDAAIQTHYVRSRTITSAGVLGTAADVIRSLG